MDFETGGTLGCGHREDGRFVFRCFTAAALTEAAEAEVIERWLGHMEEVQRRLGFVGSPRVFHWSPAEESAYATAYKRVERRGGGTAGWGGSGRR